MIRESEFKTVSLDVTLYKRHGEYDILVRSTPRELWEFLPKKPVCLETGETGETNYQKTFSVSYRRRLYTISFFFTERKP